jgi:hypothetical protein
MQQNLNDIDRFVRIIIGGAMLLSATYVQMNGFTSIILSILGLLLMLSGLASFCPLYHLLGINTKK